jgi:hypothetical protein
MATVRNFEVLGPYGEFNGDKILLLVESKLGSITVAVPS